MTRRQFVFVATLMATVGWAKASFWKRRFEEVLLGDPTQEGVTMDLRNSLNGIFSNAEAPRLLGERYLNDYPDGRTGSLALAEYLRQTGVPTSEGVKRMLAQKCESDFYRGDLVSIDGVLLARTEAEACALTILL